MTYQLFTTIIAILVGLVMVLFSRQVIEAQKSFWSKQNHHIGRLMFERISRPYMRFMTPLVGAGLVIVSIFRLLGFF